MERLAFRRQTLLHVHRPRRWTQNPASPQRAVYRPACLCSQVLPSRHPKGLCCPERRAQRNLREIRQRLAKVLGTGTCWVSQVTLMRLFRVTYSVNLNTSRYRLVSINHVTRYLHRCQTCMMIPVNSLRTHSDTLYITADDTSSYRRECCAARQAALQAAARSVQN